MNELISHIEFLLHEHNCVIIPGFGGFVVNTIPSRRDGFATFLPPSGELVFNRDLTHNDGLLAESYMKSNQLMFDAAMQQIEQAVEELKHQLREQRHVELGKLGSFTMSDEKRFFYTPANFVRPALFGLNRATLKPLIQMQSEAVSSRQIGRNRRLSNVSISAVVSVAVLLLMFLLPASDTTIKRQSAQMIGETSLFGIRPALTNAREHAMVKSENHSSSSSPEAPSENATDAAPLTPATQELSPTGDGKMENDIEPLTPATQELSPKGAQYYIVVGVFKLPDMAQKMMETLRNEGFTQRGFLHRSGRIDVYAASFIEKTEAEAFLREIHKQYSTHSDAWILKRE
jgi:cell division septation protein DedD